MKDLRFQCQPGCIRCCDQKGFVYLGTTDIPRIAAYLGMTEAAFEHRYVYRTKNYARLRTPPGKLQCHFLTAQGCSIHSVKPTQCRTFPFWPEIVESQSEWHKAASWCPGIGEGDLIQIDLIESAARQMRAAYPHSYGGEPEVMPADPEPLGPQRR